MKANALRNCSLAVVTGLALTAAAADLGTGTLTLVDTYSGPNYDWKTNVSALVVHVPMEFVDSNGNPIEGRDATFRVGTNDHVNAGYLFDASGKVAPSEWGTINRSFWHLLDLKFLQTGDGSRYTFARTEISADEGESWGPAYSADGGNMDICCNHCSQTSYVKNYGWRVFLASDTGTATPMLSDDHKVRLRLVYTLTSTADSVGTLTLVDGFGHEDWKKKYAETTVHVPLEFVNTKDEPIRGLDEAFRNITFEVKPEQEGGMGDVAYFLGGRRKDDARAVFRIVERLEGRASNLARYAFERVEVSEDGSSWKTVYTDNGGNYDLNCQGSSSQTETSDYGWQVFVSGGTKLRLKHDDHGIRFRAVYRTTFLGDNYAIQTVDAKDCGITFKLFDYTETDINDSYLGKGTWFLFRDGTRETPTVNHNTDEDGFEKRHATVLPTLQDGYPVFSGMREGTRYCDDTSLRYLFDGTAGGKGVTEYNPVNLPVKLNEDGTYTYNSQENACDYDKESNRLLVRTYRERSNEAAKQSNQSYDFLPFTYWDGVTVKKTAGGQEYQYEEKNVKVWFGYSMEYDFKTPSVEEDINSVFTFSGDDDVWVFIDDVLVLDLGGTHGRCTGTIDFQTGEITAHLDWQGQTTPSYPTTLRRQFETAQREDSVEWDDPANPKTFAKDTVHRLKMFYLERGGTIANCNLKINMSVLHDVFKMPASVWITDHEDEGNGKVHLAFKPEFDEDVDLLEWIVRANAEKRIKVAYSNKKGDLPKAVAQVAPLRDGDGKRDVDKGWVWITITLPEAEIGNEGLIWSVVIDDEAEKVK